MPSNRCEIMVIGEAPGATEDVQGKPFIGASGAKLARALEMAGINDYYVSNVVKCFPAVKKTPTTTQVSACKPYLWEEIREVQPRFILALGNFSWHQFGKGGITEHAGKETYINSINAWVMPALHPAAILRRMEQERAWMADIMRFGRLVRGELVSEPPVQVHVIRDGRALEQTGRLLAEWGFSYDFESTPVPWWHRDFRPYCISFSVTGGESYVVPLFHPDIDPSWFPTVVRWAREFSSVMADPRVHKCGHNATLYDDLVWYRLTGTLPHCSFDTMPAAHLWDETQPKGLKWQGRAHLGWPQWDIDAKKQHPFEKLAVYNGYDTAATVLLRDFYQEKFKEDPRLGEYFQVLEMPKLRALNRMVARGVHINAAAALDKIKESGHRREAVRAYIPVDNPNSNVQVAKWLYADMKLPIIKKTPGGAPSTDEEVIKRLAISYPNVKALRYHRLYTKYNSTYLEPALEKMATSFDGLAHYEYRSTSVETGRLGSEFHTMPRFDPTDPNKMDIRSIVDAPPDWTLIQGDYAQIEARLCAWKAAGSPTDLALAPRNSMLRAWVDGRDVYKEQASYILEKPKELLTKEERQICGKVVVLQLMYRSTATGLQGYLWREQEIDWSLSLCQKAVDLFYSLWPEFKLWHEREEQIIKMRGYAISDIGRVRHLPSAGSLSQKLVTEAVNQGINHPVQSVASEITQMANVLVDAKFRQETPQYAFLVGSIHDALLVQSRIDRVGDTLEVMDFYMRNSHFALRRLGFNLPPGLITVEFSQGPWGSGQVVTPPEKHDVAKVLAEVGV